MSTTTNILRASNQNALDRCAATGHHAELKSDRGKFDRGTTRFGVQPDYAGSMLIMARCKSCGSNVAFTVAMDDAAVMQ